MNYRKNFRLLFDTFLGHAGVTSTKLRKAVLERRGGNSAETISPILDIPTELNPYLSKVAQHAYQITDQDITQLKTDGYSEDEIFELTIAAALGAGKARLDLGLRLLKEAS